MMGIGMEASFVPSHDESERYTPAERRAATITGKIGYINWEHKYFTVEWTSLGQRFRESFKFADIGKRVTVGGRKKNVHTKNHRQ